MSLNYRIRQQLAGQLALGADDPASLNSALRLLAKWRSVLIQNTLLQQQGTRVLQGPLAGMDFLQQSAEGCHIAKLLGTYELPLQPFIERAISMAYHTILNIVCAEGYYAVGMALRMPQTQVLAFDVDPNARQVCSDLAQKNQVAQRVTVGGLFAPEHFAAFANQPVLLMCDIEGAERELLDPALAPCAPEHGYHRREPRVPGARHHPDVDRALQTNPQHHPRTRRRTAPAGQAAPMVPEPGPSGPVAGYLGVALRAHALAGDASTAEQLT